MTATSDFDLLDQPSELVPGFALGVLLFSMACLAGMIIGRLALRSISTYEEEYGEKIGAAGSFVVLAALLSQSLVGRNFFSLDAVGGIFGSLMLGAATALFLALVRDDVRRRLSFWFDPVLFAVALASAAQAPWIAIRAESFAAYGLISIDGLLIVCLSALAVLAAPRLGARLLGQGVLVLNLAVLVVGAVMFVRYDPFLHFASEKNGATEHKPPRVILISIDTLRSDALSCYGGGPGTPNIDKLSDDSVLFTNAYSGGPWTVPSLVTLHTGVPVPVHGISQFRLEVSDEFNTLAEHMTEAGYYSGAIVCNPNLTPQLNLVQGFHDYSVFSNNTPTYIRHEPIGRKLLRKLKLERFSQTTTRLTDLTIEWLHANQSRDFFLWVHYLDPHAPFTPPDQFRIGRQSEFTRVEMDAAWRGGMLDRRERALVKQLYDGEVRYVDHEVGRLIAALKALDLYQGSLIILTSDHGEEFWEHGSFYHGHSLYNELLHVPLIVKLPDRTEKESRPQRVSTQFVMGTILQMCGIPPLADQFEFPSLSDLLEGPQSKANLPPVIADGALQVENQKTLISDRYKIINRLASDRSEIYDLIEDGAEKTDLADQFGDTSEALLEALAEETARLGRVRETANITPQPSRRVSTRQVERLKALGYLR